MRGELIAEPQAVQAVWLECRSISGKERVKEGGERESTQVGGRCYTKESSRNNVREINARDAVTGYGEQKRHGNRHTYSAER